MRRRAALSLIIAALALAGCTAAPAPQPSTSASATPEAAPSTAPTPTVRLVAAGEAPPVVFDGDCASVLTDEEASAAAGVPVALEVEPPAEDSIRNVGGVQCSYADWDAGVHLVVGVLPLAGMGDVDPTQVDSVWAEPDCEWYCSRLDIVGDLAITTSMNKVPPGAGSDAERLLPIAQRVVETVASRAADRTDGEWRRDRTGWVDTPDCPSLSASLSSELGFAVEALDWSTYIDWPLMSGIIADQASRLWACRFVTPAGAEAEAWGYAGMAWRLPDASPDGWPAGWAGLASEDDGTLALGGSGESYRVTDGVNEMHVPAPPDGFGADARALARAVIASL